MFPHQQLDDLVSKLTSVLPIQLQNLDQEIQQQFKDILQAAFSHLNLVTRDEFDVQVKVLARTREKIELLQQQIDMLEKK